MKPEKMTAVLLVFILLTGLLMACGSTENSTEENIPSETEETVPADSQNIEEETETAVSAAEVDAEEKTEEEAAAEEEVGKEESEEFSDPYAAMDAEFIFYPLSGENNTISFWYYIPNWPNWVNSNYDFNALAAAEEATGVSLEFVEVANTTATEQFNLMIAAGDMTDLIPATEYYTGGLTVAYEEEVIIDISTYVEEYMPNYAAVLSTLSDDVQKDVLSDDMMLAFRIIADGSSSESGFITRSDWATELGYEWDSSLISLDEFTEYLRAVHTVYDTTYTYYMTDGTVSGLEAAFDTMIPTLVSDGYMVLVTSSIFRKGDTVTSGWITDGYREYLEWVRTMMEEGVIYEDFLSVDSSKLVINEAAGTGGTGVWMANADKIEEVADYATEESFGVVAMPMVTADPSEAYVWKMDSSLVTTNSGFSISTDCENPELVCQWMNYFWTTDGYYLANYGIEGETWHVEDGEPVFDWDQAVTVTGATAPNAEMAQQLFTMMRFVSFYSDHDRLYPTFPEAGIYALELWSVEGSDERYYPSTLESGFTVEENEEISRYEQDMLTYAQEACLKFMIGETEITDDTWNEYLSRMEQLGIYEVIAVYQNAYDQYLAGER